MRVAPGPLAVAAIIAPALTMTISSFALFAVETVPWLIHLSHASPAEKSVFGFTTFWDNSGSELLLLLRDILFGPVVSIPFGFAGATLYLGVAFAVASLWDSRRAYVAVGGLAGVVHAATGMALATAPDRWGLIVFLTGTLPYSLRALMAWCTAASAPVAGLVAGYVYGRLARRRGAKIERLAGEVALDKG